MSQSQNQTNNYFGSASNNQNRTINQNIDNLGARFNQLQINGVTEAGNNSQNINIGNNNNITNNNNPPKVNQTGGNNNAKVSSQNFSLNNTENELYDEVYNYYPGQMNFAPNNGGLESNIEFLNFPGEAYYSTENAEDKIENFNSSNYSSNTL